MSFGIIIPTHNRPKKLKLLLESIEPFINLYSDIQIGIHVVSNSFSLEDQTITSQFKCTHYDFSEAKGVNIARNKGIESALKFNYDYFIFLDDDCLISNNDFFIKLKEFFHAHKTTDVLGGHYENSEGASYLDRFYNFQCLKWIHHCRIGQNHWTLLGGCLVFNSHLFQNNIRFDESITYGSSETELLYRLYLDGFEMKYSKHLSVIHNPQISLIKLLKKAYRQGYFTKKFNIKSYPKRFLLLSSPVTSYEENGFRFIYRNFHLFFRIGFWLGGIR